jgi:hypothetical protein
MDLQCLSFGFGFEKGQNQKWKLKLEQYAFKKERRLPIRRKNFTERTQPLPSSWSQKQNPFSLPKPTGFTEPFNSAALNSNS